LKAFGSEKLLLKVKEYVKKIVPNNDENLLENRFVAGLESEVEHFPRRK
jgi:hypothetical protein